MRQSCLLPWDFRWGSSSVFMLAFLWGIPSRRKCCEMGWSNSFRRGWLDGSASTSLRVVESFLSRALHQTFLLTLCTSIPFRCPWLGAWRSFNGVSFGVDRGKSSKNHLVDWDLILFQPSTPRLNTFQQSSS